jgi:hypothetical protein
MGLCRIVGLDDPAAADHNHGWSLARTGASKTISGSGCKRCGTDPIRAQPPGCPQAPENVPLLATFDMDLIASPIKRNGTDQRLHASACKTHWQDVSGEPIRTAPALCGHTYRRRVGFARISASATRLPVR